MGNRRWRTTVSWIAVGLTLGVVGWWLAESPSTKTEAPRPTTSVTNPGVEPAKEEAGIRPKRIAVDDPADVERTNANGEEIVVTVVDRFGETLFGARVDAWARRGTPDGTRDELFRIEPDEGSHDDSDPHAFLCPNEAAVVEFEASCPRHDVRRHVRTLNDARRGTRIVLFETGTILLSGRLLDDRRQPWSRNALERWFGRAQHQAWTMSLVTIRGTDPQAFGGANVDFDTAEFKAVVSHEFDGEVALLDGSRKAASIRARAGDDPIELIFDPTESLTDRARLTVRLEPPPEEPVAWRMRRVSPWTTDPYTDVPTDDWIEGADGEVLAESIPEGTYLLRCERDEEILAAKSIVVQPRDDLSVVLSTWIDVAVEMHLANDDPLVARHDDGHTFQVGVTDDDGCSWGGRTLELERDGVARLVGLLPVGSWWLHTAGAAAHVVVDRGGRVEPNVVTFADKARARLRVGPCEPGTRENGGRWVRTLVRTTAGHVADHNVVSGPLDAAGFMTIEVPLPPFSVRIHITANSFAEPTIVDVDPRTVDDRVIDVVLR